MAAVLRPGPYLAPTPSPLIPTPKCELERFEDVPETQRKLLEERETHRLLKVLSLEFVYRQRIKFPSSEMEVSFGSTLAAFVLTLFQRLHAEHVLRGVYIKGGTNELFFQESDQLPYDLDLHFQIKEGNEKPLDGLILSCFAHTAGVTYTDNCRSRTYWSGAEKLAEIEPIPPRPPHFMRRPECGRFLTCENGLGNYCLVDEPKKKFALYTLYVYLGDRPLKIDVHIVEALDNNVFCSQNSVFTAIHPLLALLSSRPDLSLLNIDPRTLNLWARTYDEYPMEMALQHMGRKEFCYDPPSRARQLTEGLHIHYRLLSKGNICLTNGILDDFRDMFVRQYFERREGKGPGDDFSLRVRSLERALKRELVDHLREPVARVCYLLNLENWHFTHGTPQLDEIRNIHRGLLQHLLGVNITDPFFHFCKVHAFLYSTVARERRRIYLEFPLYSVLQVLAFKEEIFASTQLQDALYKYFPLWDNAPDRFSVYEKGIRESFADKEFPKAFSTQLPLVEQDLRARQALSTFFMMCSNDHVKVRNNPFGTLNDFAKYYPTLAQSVTAEILAKHFLLLLKNTQKGDLNIDRVLEILYPLFRKLEKSKLKNEIIEILDAHYGFAKIETSEKLREFTFFLVISNSEKLFLRGLDIYRRLAKSKEVDFRLLHTLMEHLLQSPFISNAKCFNELFSALIAVCCMSEGHCDAHEANLTHIVSKIHSETMWKDVKLLLTYFSNEKYRRLHQGLSTVWKEFFKKQKILFQGRVLLESRSIIYLEKEIIACLPPYFKQLFDNWNSETSLEMYFMLEAEFRKSLPLGDYLAIYTKFLRCCPVKRHPRVEEAIIAGFVRIKEEGQQEDLERVTKAFEEHRITKRCPKLRPLLVKQAPHEAPAAAAAAAAVAVPAPAPLPTQNIEALSYINSDAPITSIEQIRVIKTYFFNMDLRADYSAIFLLSNFLKTCLRVLEFLSKAPDADIFEFIEDLKEEERRIVAAVEAAKGRLFLNKLLMTHLTNIFIVHIGAQLIFARNNLDENLRAKIEGFIRCASFHIDCFNRLIFSEGTFLEVWKKILKAMLSFPRTFNIFVQIYEQTYKTAQLDKLVFQELRFLFVEELVEQFVRQGNAIYLETALNILEELNKESQTLSKFPYPRVFQCASQFLSAVLKVKEMNQQMIRISGRFAKFVNVAMPPTGHRAWKEQLQNFSLDEFISKAKVLMSLIDKP